MNLKLIKDFISLAKEEGVSELKYEHNDIKLYVALNASHRIMRPEQDPKNENVGIDNHQDEFFIKNNIDHKNIFLATSPFVGTFYKQPTPDAIPYVKLGDRVIKGQVLCIIEAMKIMNEIEADVSGEIIEVCVENENYVEFGQTLFKIKMS